MGAAILYGIFHDQVTARLCLEYFTIAHPPLFPTQSPTLLAICWGITATSGLGLVFGAVLAQVAHAGNEPPTCWKRLRRPIGRLLAAMAISAATAGAVGHFFAQTGAITLPLAFIGVIPEVRHPVFMSVWFAHIASYAVGIAGAVWLIFSVWRNRGRPATFKFLPATPSAVGRATILGFGAGVVVWHRFFSR